VKDDGFSLLVDMMGVGGLSFDDDNVIANNEQRR
jgi:hypothetical protein